MEGLFPTFRVLHVVLGILWAGTTFFAALFLEPCLWTLGSDIRRPVLRFLMPRLTPVMMVSSVLIAATGILMVLVLTGGRLDTMFSNGWGWAIVIGAVATAGAMVVGFGGLAPLGMRLERLEAQVDGRSATQEEALNISRLSDRLQTLSRINFALLLIAALSMPLARFL